MDCHQKDSIFLVLSTGQTKIAIVKQLCLRLRLSQWFVSLSVYKKRKKEKKCHPPTTHHTTFSGPQKALRKSASRLQVKPNGRSRPPPPFPSLGGSKARSLIDPRRTYDPTKPRVPDYAFGFIPQSQEPVAVAFALKPNIPQHTQSLVTGMLT